MHHRLRWIPLCLATSVCLTACSADGEERFIPFRDGWVTELDGIPFPHLADDGTALITTLTIGGEGDGENFYNRGDIIVEYDASHNGGPGQPGQITVELRRFTGASDEGAAGDDFDALNLWAYADPSPQKPSDSDASLDCSETWQEGCHIRIWYDGIDQPIRSGADIRVTLPADYTQPITVVTEDNDQDSNYLNRGNVCIRDLAGSADVTIGNGLAFASLASDIAPAPTCSPSQIEACETYEDDEGNPAPWDPACGCDTFGTLNVSTRGSAAADMEVDIPATLWSSLFGQNQDTARRTDCTADADVANATDLVPPSGPWEFNKETNRPGDSAPEGAGYAVNLTAAACAPVSFTENPGDFIGEDADPDDQESERRGNLTVCNDCNRASSCADLLPGGI